MDTKKSSRILVIDDDEHLVTALATRLKASGYQCVTASNGQEGLSEYSLGDIDLVVTDLNMPALDGVGFVNRIRADSSVPIIVMTGFTDQYREHLRAIPDVTLVQKPMDSHAFLDLVQVELSQRSSRLAG